MKIKKMFAAALAAAIMATMTACAPSTTIEEPKYDETLRNYNSANSYKTSKSDEPNYDINGDGSVTIADVTALLRKVVSGESDQAYDLNGDTRVDIYDIIQMLKYIVNTDTSPDPENTDPVVFFTSDISPKGLMSVYEALGVNLSGKVAVKISTGEPPASNYLRPELIKDLVQSVNGTIVECNTAYGGSRAQTAMHYQVAKDHGFTVIADFQILDENGSMTLPVSGGSVLKENYVGKAFADYDSYLILSHFKGHSMACFGGAIKNISIGLGSSEGKAWIHSGGTSKKNAWGGKQDDFLEAMAEAGKSVADYLGNGERIVYVNVMNRLSVD